MMALKQAPLSDDGSCEDCDTPADPGLVPGQVTLEVQA